MAIIGAYIQNLAGLSFLMSNQLGISASMNVILQVPLQRPVMERELANKMYGPSAYFTARFFSNMLIQLLYPIIMILILFWGLGIVSSFENLCWIMLYGILGAIVFSG